MSELLFHLDESHSQGARIRVIGVGGAGGNAVDRMINSRLKGVEFAVVNTDLQALNVNSASIKVQIGKHETRGLGAGADPERARRAVIEDTDEIRPLVQGADMVFVTAGMGGGTGTGAAPEVATLAREAGALTVGIVTRPFVFEGRPRMRRADEGLARLKECVDTLIVVPNQRLQSIVDNTCALTDAFKIADEVLLQAVKGISDLITVTGLINLDFADVRAVMSEPGEALMGVGSASGEYAAVEASQKAISSPLLDECSIQGARALLINITGGPQMTLNDVSEASKVIYDEAGPDCDIFFGAVMDPAMEGQIRVTVIATGLGRGGELQGEIAPASRTAPAGQTYVLPEPAPAPEKRMVAETPVVVEYRPDPRDLPGREARPAEPRVQDLRADARGSLLENHPFAPRADRTQTERAQNINAGLRSEEENLDVPAFLRRSMD
jgi:cell division protein FtsZ